MASALRSSYHQARASLGALHHHLAVLEDLGIREPWRSALHLDLRRLSRSLQAALEDAERHAATAVDGLTAPVQSPPTAIERWTFPAADGATATFKPTVLG